MATQSSSSSNPGPGTLTGEQTSSTKSRRSKSPRRASAPRAGKTGTPSAEILFKELPNPYQTPQPPYIWIDYPQEGERLLGPAYNVRLGVGGAEKAEISIDGGPWQNCRLTSGYWWYDWSGIQPGKHTLVARMRTSNGRWYRTPARTCDFRP